MCVTFSKVQSSAVVSIIQLYKTTSASLYSVLFQTQSNNGPQLFVSFVPRSIIDSTNPSRLRTNDICFATFLIENRVLENKLRHLHEFPHPVSPESTTTRYFQRFRNFISGFGGQIVPNGLHFECCRVFIGFEIVATNRTHLSIVRFVPLFELAKVDCLRCCVSHCCCFCFCLY